MIEAAMLGALLGRKIGMTQLFDQEGNVVPVTVIDCAKWYITQIKTKEKDNYTALQVGLLKKKFQQMPFTADWLQAKRKFFLHLKEVRLGEQEHEFQVGQELVFKDVEPLEGQIVDVTGKSRGLGFQGVIKRWGFGRGPESHGSNFHRRPGASGCMRAEGEVRKGRKLAGHQGDKQITVKGLKVIKADEATRCLFVKGAVPGKKNSLVAIKKQGK